MNDIKTIQKAELDILCDVIQSFEKCGIKYYLGFGTLLGAVRHKGFIPWDDDVDLFIPRPDFERIKAFENGIIPQPYYLSGNTNTNSSPHTFILRVENPQKQFCIEKNGQVFKQNVWLDLFPIDGVPSNHVKRILLFVRFRILYILLRIARSSLSGVSNNSDRSFMEKCAIAINEYFNIGRLLDSRKIINRFDRIRMKYPYAESKYVCPLTIDYMEKCICDREWLGEGKTAFFENIKVTIPSNSDSLLKRIYGDYMKLPSVTDRHPKHSIL